ncbi:MAG: bifunctional adenosylcobinamide kinase/adenosylcobinamide-phosphate guanylyltransferase [Deltaproteobacteria bacterium]|nr:bifunctional adenosylcobinamide kinase/adenosylcobinamide-phosphate guanylyltransferase [Deltaproteobacteria bacterium]
MVQRRGRGLNTKRQGQGVKGSRDQGDKPKNSRLTTYDPRLIFITGGCRSGKSAYALKLAESMKGKKAYLATGEPLDKEMSERIKKHKKERGNSWATIEEPINIINIIRKNKKYDVILLDCLTLWISNMLCKSEIRNPKSEILKLISACKDKKFTIIIVSNEVGLGIVPDNKVAREFRDIAGYANQSIAKKADEVYFVVSGIPIRLK